MTYTKENFNNTFKEKINTINTALDTYIPIQNEIPEIIYDSMRYSIFAGGKRLRPILMMACYEALGGHGDEIIPFACAIEMIHTYSLIHDDLPTMDNDDFRRGKPTNHKVYGEAVALLAGDALLNLAFETMITAAKKYPQIPCLDALDIIAKASGTRGMIGGQTMDLLSENKDIDINTLQYIHENKTAAMICAAVKAGAAMAQASIEEIQIVERFGYCLGMAFQIQDDILDVISTTEQLGKPIHSDIKNHKSTYVSIVGLEESKQYVEKLSKEASDALHTLTNHTLTNHILQENGHFLLSLTKYLMHRSY